MKSCIESVLSVSTEAHPNVESVEAERRIMTSKEVLEKLYQVVAPEFREAVAEGIRALEKLEDDDNDN